MNCAGKEENEGRHLLVGKSSLSRVPKKWRRAERSDDPEREEPPSLQRHPISVVTHVRMSDEIFVSNECKAKYFVSTLLYHAKERRYLNPISVITHVRMSDDLFASNECVAKYFSSTLLYHVQERRFLKPP